MLCVCVCVCVFQWITVVLGVFWEWAQGWGWGCLFFVSVHVLCVLCCDGRLNVSYVFHPSMTCVVVWLWGVWELCVRIARRWTVGRSVGRSVCGLPLQAAQAVPVPPAERWEIDYKALTINQRVGVGSFGEVFKVRPPSFVAGWVEGGRDG
jgi:hypothetical protein